MFFTLTELLTAIGVIALLAALLLPALNKAREKAKEITCTGNLRQIGMASLSYTSDNQDYLPPINNSNHGTRRITVFSQAMRERKLTPTNRAASGSVPRMNRLLRRRERRENTTTPICRL